jgi:predicted phosphodiesterase
MLFGALGDIHGDFECARRTIARHPDVPFWLCVGDIADDEGRYASLPAPLYWIKGNNENFDAIASGDLPGHLHFIPNGQLIRISGSTLRVAGLGGTFAPSWYDTPAAGLPHPRKGSRKATDLADKRRHFVRAEVEACKALRDVDVLLTHEAPRPFRIGRVDAGKTPVNEVLAAMRPRLHLFGHHHRFSEQDRQGVRSVGLDLVSRSYLLIDASTLDYDLKTLDA